MCDADDSSILQATREIPALRGFRADIADADAVDRFLQAREGCVTAPTNVLPTALGSL
jgi:hypothetical protein